MSPRHVHAAAFTVLRIAHLGQAAALQVVATAPELALGRARLWRDSQVCDLVEGFTDELPKDVLQSLLEQMDTRYDHLKVRLSANNLSNRRPLPTHAGSGQRSRVPGASRSPENIWPVSKAEPGGRATPSYHLPPSSSASRLTAGAFGFLTFTQCAALAIIVCSWPPPVELHEHRPTDQSSFFVHPKSL